MQGKGHGQSNKMSFKRVSLVEYEVSISYGSKVMSKVKVFCNSQTES